MIRSHMSLPGQLQQAGCINFPLKKNLIYKVVKSMQIHNVYVIFASICVNYLPSSSIHLNYDLTAKHCKEKQDLRFSQR